MGTKNKQLQTKNKTLPQITPILAELKLVLTQKTNHGKTNNG